MFKVAVSPHYWTEVTVFILDEEGKSQKFTFDAKFKRLSIDEMQDLNDRVAPTADEEGNKPEALTDRQLLDEVFLDWRRVLDEDGNAMSFEVANIDRVLGIYPVQPTLVQTFYGSMSGAKAKNSPAPRNTGPAARAK